MMKKRTTHVGEDQKKLKPSDVADGNIKWGGAFGKKFGNSSKSKHRLTIQTSNSTSRYSINKRTENICLHKDLCTSIHSSIIYIARKYKPQMSINKCLSKKGRIIIIYIH